MSSKKGTRSKSHPGEKNYTTKKGDKVYHRMDHYVRKANQPYSFHQLVAGSKKRRTKRRRRSGKKSRKHR